MLALNQSLAILFVPPSLPLYSVIFFSSCCYYTETPITDIHKCLKSATCLVDYTVRYYIILIPPPPNLLSSNSWALFIAAELLEACLRSQNSNSSGLVLFSSLTLEASQDQACDLGRCYVAFQDPMTRSH